MNKEGQNKHNQERELIKGNNQLELISLEGEIGSKEKKNKNKRRRK